MTAVTDLPLINPTVADLLARVEGIRDSRRIPLGMAMSPETWERLKAEPFSGVVVDDYTSKRRAFTGVPVNLYEGCLGVGITFEAVR